MTTESLPDLIERLRELEVPRCKPGRYARAVHVEDLARLLAIAEAARDVMDSHDGWVASQNRGNGPEPLHQWGQDAFRALLAALDATTEETA